jgi:hypothetical protein
MTSFIQNMLWNSVSGFVEEGKRTVGTYAGDALIKAGDLVEGGGRTVGNGMFCLCPYLLPPALQQRIFSRHTQHTH